MGGFGRRNNSYKGWDSLVQAVVSDNLALAGASMGILLSWMRFEKMLPNYLHSPLFANTQYVGTATPIKPVVRLNVLERDRKLSICRLSSTVK